MTDTELRLATEDTLSAAVVPDPDLVGMLRGLFADYRSRRPAPTEVVDLDRSLWSQLEELGLTRLTAAEDRGGSGGTWADAAALLGLAAGAAAPVPLAENDLLADWLLATARLPNDGGIRTVCRPSLAGVARDVPWGRDADHVVALWADRGRLTVTDVPVSRTTMERRRNVAGEPSDTVTFRVDDLRDGVVVDAAVAEELQWRGALAASAAAVGAMDRVVEVVLGHVNDRTQFGRPIGRFQAVQNLVCDIAAQTALARAATDAAVARAAASDGTDDEMRFAVAVAKSCVGHASSTVVRGSHQVLGAIGTTLEHELHTLTKPILARRQAWGSVREWDATLTSLAISAGRDGLWPLVTSGRLPTPPQEVHQ